MDESRIDIDCLNTVNDRIPGERTDGRTSACSGVSPTISRIELAYSNCHEGMLQYAYRWVGSYETAQDVVQQAFTNTLAAVERGAKIRNMDGFLRRCVHNLCASHSCRRLDVPLKEDEWGLPTMRSSAESVELRERCRNLQGAVDQLAPSQRRAFLLSEIRGLSYEDISNSMGRSKESVRQLLNRARCKIRTAARTGSDWIGCLTPALLGFNRMRDRWKTFIFRSAASRLKRKMSNAQLRFSSSMQVKAEAMQQSVVAMLTGVTVIAVATLSVPTVTQKDPRSKVLISRSVPSHAILELNQREVRSRPSTSEGYAEGYYTKAIGEKEGSNTDNHTTVQKDATTTNAYEDSEVGYMYYGSADNNLEACAANTGRESTVGDTIYIGSKYIQNIREKVQLPSEIGLLVWELVGSGQDGLNEPNGVATDQSSNAYVANTENHQIQETDARANNLFGCGEYVTGHSSFTRQKGVPNDASVGYVNVVDAGFNRMQKLGAEGKHIRQRDIHSDEMVNGLISLEGVATEPSSNIHTADTRHNHIKKYNSDTDYVAERGGLGANEGVSNVRAVEATNRSENVYIIDAEIERIQKFEPSGEYVVQNGDLDSGEAENNEPIGVTTDSPDNVDVTYLGNNQVQKFTADD